MQITPFEELEAFARAEYARKFRDQPEPTPINVEAVLAIGKPRLFSWGGIGLRAPPLSFSAGLELFTTLKHLEALVRAGAIATSTYRAAHRVAAILVHRVVHPLGRWRRLRWRFRQPFLKASPDAMVELLQGLLGFADETPLVGGQPARTINWIDNLAAFAARFPSWIGADGLPLSWPLFHYGVRYLIRDAARQDLRQASAVRVATHATPNNYTSWDRELRPIAGW